MQNIKEIIFLVLIVLTAALPAISKPLHVDDIIFYDFAKHLQKNPLAPYSYTYGMVGILHKGYDNIDPPFVSYYYAGLMSIFGDSVTILHAFNIIFPLIAAISMFYLSKRFVKNSFMSAMLFIATPAFIVMSHNLMLDIPAISFFLASLALFVYGVDYKKPKLIWLSVVFASITPLIKYNALLLLPLMALYLIIRKEYKGLPYVAVPLAVFLLWSFVTYKMYGLPHPLSSAIGIHSSIESVDITFLKTLSFIGIRIVTNMVYLGGIALFGAVFAVPLLRHRACRIIFAISLIVSGFISIGIKIMSKGFFSGEYSFLETFMIWIFAAIGIFYALLLLVESYKAARRKFDADTVFLFLWLAASFAGSILFAGGAVRYITMLLPPFILLLVLIIEKNRLLSKKSLRICGNAGVSAALILSAVLAYADYQQASVYKTFPSELGGRYNFPANAKVHYFGDYGFSHAMSKMGYSYIITEDIDAMLEKDKEMGKKTFIVKPQILFPRDINRLYFDKSLKEVKKIEVNTLFPVRVQNYQAHAGFYTFSAGILPYKISKKPLEVFYIYE